MLHSLDRLARFLTRFIISTTITEDSVYARQETFRVLCALAD